MKWKEEEIKGDRLKHLLSVSLYVSAYGSIHAKASIGVRCSSVVSCLGLMNMGIVIGCGYDESVCVCVYIRIWERFITPRLLCSFVDAAELLFLRESSSRASYLLPKGKYRQQSVCNSASYPTTQVLAADRPSFLMGLSISFDEFWLSWWEGAKTSRYVWLHSQPSMVLPVPTPVPPLCQLTLVLASINLTSPCQSFSEAEHLPRSLQRAQPTTAMALDMVYPRLLWPRYP